MENNELEETQPYVPRSEEKEELSQQENTLPSKVNNSLSLPADLDQTVPVLLHQESAEAAALEQTLPPPVPFTQPPIEPDDTVISVPYTAAAASIVVPQGMPFQEEPAVQPEDTVVAPQTPAPGSQSTESGPPTPPSAAAPGARRSFPLRWIALLGVLVLLAIGAASAYGGYQSGINQRIAAGATQAAAQVEEQFVLGLQDLEARRFDLARQRFEYVIQVDPSYPGVTEKLAEALLSMQSTATPTTAPTPTITPTPDLRNVDERYSQAQQSLANGDYSAAIETLLALRKVAPEFKPVDVDGMLYIAYRNRGADKILRDGDLEGGIFDLTEAEQIGPLDTDSKSYLTWASLYKTGASFWELDWAQAVYYFAQIAPALPNLRDGSGWTATERLHLALVGYGDFLAQNGDICAAVEQYDQALGIYLDPLVEEKRNNASDECDGGGDDDEGDSDESSGDTSNEPPPTEPPAATEPPPTEPPAATEPPPADSTPVPSP
jgi:tetratricopeptide (TPR) repeat protein